MPRKAGRVAAVHRSLVRPRPAAKFGAAVVGKGLVDFGFRVHHERAVLRHWLGNRFALQHQKFSHIAAGVDQFYRGAGAQFDGGVMGDGLTRNADRRAFKKVKRAPGLCTMSGG